MGNNISSSSSSGIGFLGALTVAFVVLKLTGYITWSWWLVTLPIWGPAIGVIAFFFIMFILTSRL